ncbi:MAG: NFACT family protein [Defluviitaleaceae bacterium]|nr:NFACT family protein [Defluviitaleaceae bacterium]
MPLDGICIASVVKELRETLLDGRIEKIYQPERDDVIWLVRGHGVNRRLLLSANPSQPRLCLTQASRENPMQAPLFCMVMRKHLAGGRVTGISQPGFERIVEISVESLNEMGDMSAKKCVIEIMGKHSNIILLDENGVILDAARRVSLDISSVREVLPGKKYVYPPSKDKKNPLEATKEDFRQNIAARAGQKLQSAVYQAYSGVSPLMGSEICVRAGLDPGMFAGELSEDDSGGLWRSFDKVFGLVRAGEYENVIYLDEQGKKTDFSALDVSFLPGERRRFASPSEMLEHYYSERDAAYRTGQKTADLRKLIQQHIDRCAKKAQVYAQTMKDIEDRDQLRIFGEVITAGIYEIQKGMTTYTAPNFYDETGGEVTVRLDPELTPSENAQRYFRKYNKAKRTHAALQDQIRQNAGDAAYLDGVMASLQNVAEEADIAEIREELAGSGFLKKTGKKTASRPKKSKPLRFVTGDGFEVYVGKNNIQNDELTMHMASNYDIWLHVKNVPGSHVILRVPPDRTPSNQALTEAAEIAAWYSKAKDAPSAQVDYTQKKNVKKPSGAKPGFVIYDDYKTAVVKPRATL